MPIKQRADWEYTERQKLLMKGKPAVKKSEKNELAKPIDVAIHECAAILNYLSNGGREIVIVANSFHVIKDALENAQTARSGRCEVVSEPGAAIEVTRINLTDDERESLSINKRLSDLGHRAEVSERTYANEMDAKLRAFKTAERRFERNDNDLTAFPELENDIWDAAKSFFSHSVPPSEVCKCGHDKNIHHDDVDTWCGYWNAGCDCRGYQISFKSALQDLRKSVAEEEARKWIK